MPPSRCRGADPRLLQTSYTHVVGVTWAQVAGMDAAELPEEMREADFCEEFEFRAKAALRTWQVRRAARAAVLAPLCAGLPVAIK